MTQREKLIELLSSCPTDPEGSRNVAVIAQHLLDNGVVVVDNDVVSPENRPLVQTVAAMPVNEVIDLVKAKQEGRIIVPPCKVGDTVYVITDCSKIIMHYDNDYDTGTGAIECPFVDVCKFEECNDTNTQVFETYVSIILCDEYDDWTFRCEDINRSFNFEDFGKTVFLTREAAEKALEECENR